MAAACREQSDPPLVVSRYSGPEAVSQLGEPLTPPPLPDSTRLRYELEWQKARAVADTSPSNADAIIWLGRRTAYLTRYREAIDVFSAGIARHPDDARMYRHRGHRYITIRKVDSAIADLNKAVQLIVGRQDEIEPDGLPNARNTPTSTLQFNVWYHLGLAHYLKGSFDKSAESFQQALAVSKNPDMQVASSYWLHLAYQRTKEGAAAAHVLEPITRELNVIENRSYHSLLLMYKKQLPVDSLLAPATGAASVQDASILYGVGAWHLYNGRPREARELFDRIRKGTAWAAFGYIAAEAEIARAPK